MQAAATVADPVKITGYIPDEALGQLRALSVNGTAEAVLIVTEELERLYSLSLRCTCQGERPAELSTRVDKPAHKVGVDTSQPVHKKAVGTQLSTLSTKTCPQIRATWTAHKPDGNTSASGWAR